MNLYVYSLDDNIHTATITGASNIDCEAKANNVYGSNEFSWTYSPAFGASDGLLENNNAEIIVLSSKGGT